MSSGKKYKPWSDRVHESIVSRNASGQLNLVIKGGAEEGKFPFFGPVKQDKVIYHSGKIQDGEILLEVNDQSIVGLTLYDLNNLIIKTSDPVRFKSVKEGQALVKDLKVYLNQRFDKNSVDHQLQAAIRDNLYLRTLPCTTRKLRNGETDGVDYTFLTVEQFKELEDSGALLESGIFEGNYYGTPKPPPKPLSSQDVNQSSSSGDLSSLNNPSTESKRKRNKSNTEQLSPASEVNDNCLSGGEATVTNYDNFSKDSHSIVTNGEVSNDDTAKKEPTIEESVVHSEKILGPLPEGWEMAQTDNGDFYFIDHLGKKTSWVDPRLDNPNRKTLEECEDDELPYGWEKVDGDPQFGTYYVDHVEKITQIANPVLEVKKKLQQDDSSAQKPPDMNIPNDVADSAVSPDSDVFQFTNDPSKLRGKSHLVPIEKREKGFGFTIVGGDDPQEFLQIKSVVADGAAALSGNIEQGDIIVRVNDRCVLGWTHPDVVKLFQAIPIGQIVNLELCRGYPLLVDSDDPDAKFVTTRAIRPEDKPIEEFERQLRVLNSQLERTNHDEYYSGMENMNLSSPSKSMPDITMDQNYDARGYYGNTDLPPAATFLPQNMYARSGSMGALPAPVVIQVIVEKGGEGFGFTIADSPKGQRVKQILDGARCQELMEGDVLLEINGMAVQNMPHNNVVQLLKDCPFNSAAIFVIQRGPVLIGGGQGFGVPAGARSNLGPGANMHDPYAYPAQDQGYMSRMKRSLTEPGLGSENGSVVSAPPGSSMGPPNPNFPLTSMLNDYRTKHAVNMDRGNTFNPPSSSAYQMYSAPQSLYHDPYSSSIQDPWTHHNVLLRREESGFGFRILGGNAHGEAVTIGAIVPNGAAAKEGTLRTGDELLTVDGQRVTRMGHNQVVSLMGNAARNAVVQLGIRRKVDGSQMGARPFRGPAQRQLVGPGSRPSSRGPNTAIANLQPFDLVIHRRPHEGFGFVIISSVKSGIGLQAPHKIGRIIEGSPADRCGQLRVGDRILAVNDVDITHLHHGQIVNLIKDSALSINIRVLPLDDDDEEDASDAQDDRGLKVVELQRWPRGFGFGIRGGREYNMPLYVLRVADDGPAAASGQVKVGDILLEINGRSTLDIPHGEAINLIRQGGSTVRLVLKQGDGKVPELETNPAESVHSLSSSAVSGMDPTGKRNPPRDPDYKGLSSSPNSNSPVKSSLSPTRAAQNSFKYARRRANSSGQILPIEDPPNSPPRLRRAITPNPTLAYREAGYLASESDGPENPLFQGAFPRSKSYDNPQNGGHSRVPNDKARMTPKQDFDRGDFCGSNPPSHLPQTHTNGGEPSGDFALLTNQTSVGEDGKKSKGSKKSKFGKSKLSKVGLWVSPKKKSN